MNAPNGTVAVHASRGQPPPALPVYELMRKCVALRLVPLPAGRAAGPRH